MFCTHSAIAKHINGINIFYSYPIKTTP